jgi:ABC-type transport system involved in multi-copper enzyme maturation permease subunit
MELMTFEWRRATSIRTTWITAFFLIASVAALAYLGSLETVDEVGPIEVSASEVLLFSIAANPVVMVLAASLGAMAFGHEYRYGTIRLTLTAFPRRVAVFFAKLLMTLLVVMMTVAVAGAVGYGLLTLLGKTVADGPPWSDVVWQSAVIALTYGLLAFSLTVITRNHPLGIIGPLLLFLLESVLVSLLAGRFAWLPEVLPLTTMQAWFAGQDAVQSAGVWAGWIVGLLVLGLVLLKRRDA